MSLKCRLRGRSHGDDGQKAADRIEELEKQVRELQEELARYRNLLASALTQVPVGAFTRDKIEIFQKAIGATGGEE